MVAAAAAAIPDLASDKAVSILEASLASKRAPCRIAAAVELVRFLSQPDVVP